MLFRLNNTPWIYVTRQTNQLLNLKNTERVNSLLFKPGILRLGSWTDKGQQTNFKLYSKYKYEIIIYL